jgi:hypothetical protein
VIPQPPFVGFGARPAWCVCLDTKYAENIPFGGVDDDRTGSLT